jgi:Arc/MetJ family transcription regulator
MPTSLSASLSALTLEVASGWVYHKPTFPYEPMPMKTTLELPEDLYRQAKALAALKGQTMKDWLTALLRRELEAPGTARESGDAAAVDTFNAELDRLSKRVAAGWKGPQDAVQAVREQRRSLGG